MNIEHDYLRLLKDILDNGVEKEDRTGTGTISVFGRQIRHDMSKGFPLITTKKMYWKGIVTELLWFLRGSTQGQELIKDNCHIWDGDMYRAYLDEYKKYKENFNKEDLSSNGEPLSKKEFIEKIKTDDEFAKKFGSLGPIYGKQWRNWTKDKDAGAVEGGVFVEYEQIDQIANLINDLKTNPDSRRLMVNAWNVGEISQMSLPPCHYGFQVYTRELSFEERWELAKRFGYVAEDATIPSADDQYSSINAREELNSMWNDKVLKTNRAISLMFNMRSNDVPLGLPFNIASYALLLEIFGKMVNMIPDELIVNIGDGHIYKNQIGGIKEQLTREPYTLPKLVISDGVNCTGTIDEFLNSCSISDFKIEDYKSHPTIKMPLSN